MFHHTNLDCLQFPLFLREEFHTSSTQDAAKITAHHTVDSLAVNSHIVASECKEIFVIIDVVSHFFAIAPQHVVSRRREIALNFPRTVLMWLCVQHSPASLSKIGLFFHGRSASTVRRYCLDLQWKMQQYAQIQHLVRDISLDVEKKLYELRKNQLKKEMC